MEDEWTVNANEAITVSLVTPTADGLKKLESFNPKFTYPIFGEEERIFGYKGLKVNLEYNASDMRPRLSVNSSRKFKAVGDVEPVDVRGTLEEFLPPVALQSQQDFELAVKDSPVDWTPPGSLVNTIEKNGSTYEIWKGNLADPAVKQLLNRIQIFVLFYIEGGSFIGKDAEGKDEPDYSLARWSVYFIYKKEQHPEIEGKTQYTFQGYSTVYNFWMFQQPTPPSSPAKGSALLQAAPNDAWELPAEELPVSESPHRARISQFVILPPFQGKGIGAMLYNTIYELQAKDDSTKEVTVEDPNEAFDLLRDLCDMKYLRKNEQDFASLKISTNVTIPIKGGVLHNNTQISAADGAGTASDGIVDLDALEKLRVKVKIAPRQFSRLVEMHLMSRLPTSVRPLGPGAESDAKKPIPSKADKQVYSLWRLLLKQRLYRRNISILGEFDITERIIKLDETVANVEFEYAAIMERVDAKHTANGKRKLDDAAEAGPASKRAHVEDA